MKYASQIEDFFMSKDAYTFIFESKEDYDKFASEVGVVVCCGCGLIISFRFAIN